MSHGKFKAKILPMEERIFRYAVSILSDPSQARDVVQDVLEKLWKNRDTLPYGGNIEGFVYSSVRNRSLDVLRHARRRKETGQEDGNITGRLRAEDVARRIELRNLKEIVRREIGMLPEKQQLVIHLRDIEGCEFEEIVRITGIEEPTARVMLSRARKAIREKLIKIEKHGI